jgi:glutathione peroxidase
MYDQYDGKGLRLLAFPCNQFGAQEPGTNKEILDFVQQNFGAKDKFTWFEKGHVNGKDTMEVYSFLKAALPSEDGSTDIRWNFAKFLVDHEGKPYKRFGPKESPDSMASDVEELLKRREESTKSG